MKHRIIPITALSLSLLIVLGMGLLSCKKADVLKMATTTSTDNTGLLDYLKPVFEKDTGVELQWVAVGTGKALELGKNCDVDVLLVHAPAAEKKYIKEGHGIDRRPVMYNDFIIIGPASDPAGIRGNDIKSAMKKIMKKKSFFASRGDNSGTHKMELNLWKESGLTAPDKEKWYIQTGQGMINTINIASERKAYTLADRGTYYKYETISKGNPSLVVIVAGDQKLLNQYSVIAVNPEKCPEVKYKLACSFSDWMASASAQRLIADFKLEGKQLFTPNAGK